MPIPGTLLGPAFDACDDPTCVQGMRLTVQARGAETEVEDFDLVLVPEQDPAIVGAMLSDGTTPTPPTSVSDRGDGLGVDVGVWASLVVDVEDGWLETGLDDDDGYALVACDDGTATPAVGAAGCEQLDATASIAGSPARLTLTAPTGPLGDRSCSSPGSEVGVWLVSTTDHTCGFDPVAVVAPRAWAASDCDGDLSDWPADCDDADATRTPGAQDLCADGLDADCDQIDGAGQVRLLRAGVEVTQAASWNLAAAQAQAGDTLEFCGGTHGATAVQIAMELDVTGRDGAILQGTGTAPVIEVELPQPQTPGEPLVEVEISDVVLQGGQGVDGGGIHSRNADLTVRNVVIQGNHASSSGGGMWAVGNLSIYDTTITGNSAPRGGGLSVLTSGLEVRLDNVTIQGNSADDHGGGLHISVATVLGANGTIIEGNTAPLGGGVSIDRPTPVPPGPADTPVLRALTVAGNSGGGVAVVDHLDGEHAVLDDVQITGSTGGPGLRLIGTGGTVELTDVDITNSSSDIDGAGLAVELGAGTVTWAGGSATSNMVLPSPPDLGGGIAVTSGTLVATDVQIAMNGAGTGGGIGVAGGEARLGSGVVLGTNNAPSAGAGGYVTGGTLAICAADATVSSAVGNASETHVPTDCALVTSTTWEEGAQHCTCP